MDDDFDDASLLDDFEVESLLDDFEVESLLDDFEVLVELSDEPLPDDELSLDELEVLDELFGRLSVL